MLASLSLRLRIFLFFALMGLGGTALVFAALYAGYLRAQASDVTNGFVFAGILSALALTGLAAAVWLLFDENLAKPIERLAAQMRTRAHTDAAIALDTEGARYLGDLAYAADAVSCALSDTAMITADRIAAETARLSAEKARLTQLLTEIPVAMILVSPDNRIVLYDGQAAEVLAQIGVPRLDAPVTEYFAAASLTAARRKLDKTGKEVGFVARSEDGQQSFDARMKPVEGGGYMLVIDDSHLDIAPEAARPIVYDFDLLDRRAPGDMAATPLGDLTYAVFDTETTGLLPHKDEIVQIGAVRVLNGRIVEGEELDLLVDPGMPIPPASTRVHGISDTMVRGRPRITVAGRRFHGFASGAVIVAHNAPFDMAFLRRHKDAMGVEWDHPILDTVLLSAVIFGASETHTLDALCSRLGVTIPDHLRHTALGDARATAEVLVRLLPLCTARGLTTLGAVLSETRRHGRLLEDLN